jgi:hypothetical protein
MRRKRARWESVLGRYPHLSSDVRRDLDRQLERSPPAVLLGPRHTLRRGVAAVDEGEVVQRFGVDDELAVGGRAVDLPDAGRPQELGCGCARRMSRVLLRGMKPFLEKALIRAMRAGTVLVEAVGWRSWERIGASRCELSAAGIPPLSDRAYDHAGLRPGRSRLPGIGLACLRRISGRWREDSSRRLLQCEHASHRPHRWRRART